MARVLACGEPMAGSSPVPLEAAPVRRREPRLRSASAALDLESANSPGGARRGGGEPREEEGQGE